MAIIKEFAVNLPIKGDGIKNIGNIVQNDVGSNKFVLRLMDGNKAFNLTGYSTVTFTVLKPDGTVCIDSLGTNIAVVDAINGEVSIMLHDNALDIAGTCLATLEIYAGAVKLATSRMGFSVTGDLAQDADATGEASFPVLQALITQLSIAEDARDDAEVIRLASEMSRVNAEILRNETETNRVIAEGSRVITEVLRDEAEGIRASAEINRVVTESNRANVESIRVGKELTRNSNEDARLASEIIRVASENARALAETGRSDAEALRVLAELARASAEAARVIAEAARVNAELVRASAEAARALVEGERVAAEVLRASAEGTRIEAEEDRVAHDENMQVWEAYAGARAYVPLNKVTYNGSSYVNTVACIGVLPTNTANWLLMAAKGADGTGAGDMLASVYDPIIAGKIDDAQVLTNVPAGALFTDTLPTVENVGFLIDGATDKTTPADSDFVGLMDSAGGNVLKRLSWANLKSAIATYYNALTASLTNKTFWDTSNFFVDASAVTKKVRFDVNGTAGITGIISTAFTTAKTVNIPDANDTFVMRATTDTLTNKRVTKRTNTEASSGTSTPTGDATDIWTITALAAADTIAAPTGTPTNGQELIIRIKDNGTARALTWNAIYRSMGVVLPTTTIISKTMYCWFIYNSTDSKWDLNQLNIDGVANSGITVEDVLTSTSATNALSAKQGKALNDGKANLASPTFTGTVVLPSTTSIGNVSDVELSYLDGLTGNIQTQLSNISIGVDFMDVRNLRRLV